MSSREVSPKGVGSGIRMVQFYINRAGKNLPPSRKAELEKAKEIMRRKLQSEKNLIH
jgi:tRNA(adenine34) deaminase